jgi:hypothetical protein
MAALATGEVEQLPGAGEPQRPLDEVNLAAGGLGRDHRSPELQGQRGEK